MVTSVGSRGYGCHRRFCQSAAGVGRNGYFFVGHGITIGIHCRKLQVIVDPFGLDARNDHVEEP